ncbi:unnamed protein product [Phaeothamnion confervicola]
MTAGPEDEASKDGLVEEIKNRARGMMAAQQFLGAELLYGKGIEVKPDHVLYANRALARAGLGKHEESLADADASIAANASYSKGHFRRGQALMNLKHPADALKAFEVGLALEPDSKAFQSSIAKAKAAISAKTSSGNSSSSATSTPSSTPKPPSAKKVAKEPAVAATAAAAMEKPAPMEVEKEEDDDASAAAASSNLRGYKKRDDGRVTTYFNRDLSDAEKALLGSTAPKKLDAMDVPPSPVAGAGNGAAGGAAGNGAAAATSAWNTAGTWEEKDRTRECKERLEQLLGGLKVEKPEGTVEVTAVKDISGDASITFSRGKKRYLFDFNFDLEWEAEVEAGKAKGKLHLPDVGHDTGDGNYEIQVSVDASTPRDAMPFVNRYVKAEGAGLRSAVLEGLRQFVDDFLKMG